MMEAEKNLKNYVPQTLGIRKDAVDIAMQKRSNENIAASDGCGKSMSGTLDPAIV